MPLSVAVPFALPLAILDMLGGSELLVIFVLVLIFFGAEKMPEFAKGLGKAIREFRKAAAGVEQEFKKAMEEEPATKPTYTPTPTILPPQSAPTPQVATAPVSPIPDPYSVAHHSGTAPTSTNPLPTSPTTPTAPNDGLPATPAPSAGSTEPHVDAG